LVTEKELSDHLRAMRAACGKFLDAVPEEVVRFGGHRGHWASWTFNGAVGELRGTFGHHVAALAAQYGLDVEDKLASILPAPDADVVGVADLRDIHADERYADCTRPT
jgi:hypothetical protein